MNDNRCITSVCDCVDDLEMLMAQFNVVLDHAESKRDETCNLEGSGGWKEKQKITVLKTC